MQALSALRMSKASTLRSNAPLSDDQIIRVAPSIMAEEKHSSRGDRYGFIPTLSVLNGLRGEGFQPYEVRQTRVRDESKREHTKHMIRMRHPDALKTKDGFGEIILLNSHDGSSSFHLMSGFFRLVCANGMIAGDICEAIKVRHTGNVVDNVIEGSFKVIDGMQDVSDAIETYSSIDLNNEEAKIFAHAALSLRYDEGKAPVEPIQIIQPRRFEDRKPDLWTTFNRVQENLIRGGVPGVSATGRRMRTREVGGVTENVKLNKALWTLADQMAALKTA